MDDDRNYYRGSEWRLWDLHVHSPASFHWLGKKFGSDQSANDALLDEMIAAINSSECAVFAIMDYWTLDGWFALKRRLEQTSAPKLQKTVFPGIELRLAAPTKIRLNAHVIFSNEINDQRLHDFLSRLKLELINQPLSKNALIEYAKNANDDILKKHGSSKSIVSASDEQAFLAGCKIAEINCDSYKEAIKLVPNGEAIGFMPFTTNDGLASIDWSQHYAYTLGLFESSPIFETRDYDTWAAFAGIETVKNKTWLSDFQAALKGVPRLGVSGSDSHRFKGKPGDDNKRGYGDYPSGKKTWIKSDPTWRGLLHAIKEPANRSYMGELPPKLETLKQNKTFYIDNVKVEKIPGSPLADVWMDGCHIHLNPDLVSIIGNKGSGKSALADIIALLGNTQQKSEFSFLKKGRFRGKSDEPAKQFEATLQWHAGEPSKMLLSQDPSSERVELVRYIPQNRFEELCNDHVSGQSDVFEKELRTVIFSHVDSDVRLDALDFDQLVEQQENNFRAKLKELRKSLRILNEQIISIEDQLHPNVRKNLEEQVRLKAAQKKAHEALKPEVVLPPATELNEEQQAVNQQLGNLAVEQQRLDAEALLTTRARQDIGRKRLAIVNIDERLSIFEGQFKAFKATVEPELKVVGLALDEIISINFKREKLVALQEMTQVSKAELDVLTQGQANQLEKLRNERIALTAKLNAPQQRYQKYLAELKQWQIALSEIEGSEVEPESARGLEARLAQISMLPTHLAKKKEERLAISKEIFDVLSAQREARASLFSPLQEIIKKNDLIREEYKLLFQANLSGSAEAIASNLFDSVKQNVGELRGEDESYAAIKTRFEKYPFRSSAELIAFASEINSLLEEAAFKIQAGVPGIRALMRKDKDPVEVYDLIYGVEYLEPKYTLMFQDTPIEQLSPGQRGALLLIFYLLVDKGRNPIVLDQPEENLDNETVVGLLVPVIKEAKKTRQIIVVTHNPNLAVVCDAEQIIHAKFERKNGIKITYEAGSIENGIINRAVVDVLEGTKIAFNNRGAKYF